MYFWSNQWTYPLHYQCIVELKHVSTVACSKPTQSKWVGLTTLTSWQVLLMKSFCISHHRNIDNNWCAVNESCVFIQEASPSIKMHSSPPWCRQCFVERNVKWLARTNISAFNVFQLCWTNISGFQRVSIMFYRASSIKNKFRVVRRPPVCLIAN